MAPLKRHHRKPRVPSQQRSPMRPSWRFVSLKNCVYDRQMHRIILNSLTHRPQEPARPLPHSGV